MPDADYIPLVAVLARRLTTDEVRAVAAQMKCSPGAQPDTTDICLLITKITNEMPRLEDVNRVRARFALGGWPLADPRSDAS